MNADYHLHTPLCRHAEGHPVEFARRAAAEGLAEIGFSDHSPMPDDGFDDWRMSRHDLPRYFSMVDEARDAVPGLPVRIGLEVDYFPDGHGWIEELREMAAWDYWIGSVHYIAPGWDVDNPRWIGRFRDHDVDAIWAEYWRRYELAVRSGFFDIMAHPDLPKKFGFRPAGDLRRYYEPTIAAAAEMDVVFEINTAGWHKEVGEQYPAREFLELAFAAGIPIVLSSDAHAPDEVGRDFGRAAELARSVGFERTARFARGERGFAPL